MPAAGLSGKYTATLKAWRAFVFDRDKIDESVSRMSKAIPKGKDGSKSTRSSTSTKHQQNKA
jgi:hypothetical protein